MADFDYTGDVLRASEALGFLGAALINAETGLSAENVVGLGYLCSLVKDDLQKATDKAFQRN